MLAEHLEQHDTCAAPVPSTLFAIESPRLKLVEPVTSPITISGAASGGTAELGTKLRLERERRRISLASIAANTKIGIGLLRGLERNDVSRWPTGIFRRAFIRAYAEAIGLDADIVAREFFDAFPDRDPFPALRTSGQNSAESSRSSAKITLRLTLAESSAPGAKGQMWATLGKRLLAALCDMAALMAISLTLTLVFHAFWVPLAVTMMGYYGTSVLFLGNTPGSAAFVSRPDRDFSFRARHPR